MFVVWEQQRIKLRRPTLVIGGTGLADHWSPRAVLVVDPESGVSKFVPGDRVYPSYVVPGLFGARRWRVLSDDSERGVGDLWSRNYFEGLGYGPGRPGGTINVPA